MSGDTIMVLTDLERHNLEAFLEEHGHCTESILTLVSSSRSGIGRSTEVTCQCGLSEDITDYGPW